jgi:type VI secretion system protein ImpH
MATSIRQHDPDLDRRKLPLKEPYRFGFFQAVRLLRRLFPTRNPVGRFYPPASETVRFVANPSLAFPASEIQELALPTDGSSPVTVKVNFMGLSSPQGVLPTPYTELILDRAQKKDNAFRDFLDIFNHRFISFFYRAWEKLHFFVSFELREADSVSPLVMSLLGLGTYGLTDRQLLPDRALMFYSGLLTQKPRSAQSLKQLLEDFFGVPVEVQQFVGRWIRLQAIDQTVLDYSESPMQRLGCGAIVGDEVWDQQCTVRIKLGPLTRAEFLSFLPRKESAGYSDLKSILNFWSNNELDFEVQLVLKRDGTPALRFDDDSNVNPLLGWTTWVKNRDLQYDPGEATVYIGRNEASV